MSFAELDAVSGLDRGGDLKKRQPALHDYLAANVEEEPKRDVLALLVLAMDYVH